MVMGDKGNTTSKEVGKTTMIPYVEDRLNDLVHTEQYFESF